MRKRVVLHIITRLDMGGSAQNTLLTCLGHDRARYRTVLVHGLSLESNMTVAEKAAVGRLTREAISAGIAMMPVPTLVRRIHPVWDMAACLALLGIIVRERPDIVHTHTSKAGVLGRLAAWVACVPIIVHTPHGHLYYGHFGPVATEVFRRIEKIMSRITTHFIALTNREKHDHVTYLELGEEKFTVIHSGVDIEKFRLANVDIAAKKRSVGLDPQGKVVGTVGWLMPIKGPAHLLTAMKAILAKHADAQLVFIGKGDLRRELENRARGLGIAKNVTFLGWRDDIHEILPVFDVFVLPSLNEGMGRVVVEAMAAGKPVVASDTGGIPDLVTDGQNGFLFPPGDENAMAEAICRLLDHPDMAVKMGEKGKSIAESFSKASMTGKIESLYHELLDL